MNCNVPFFDPAGRDAQTDGQAAGGARVGSCSPGDESMASRYRMLYESTPAMLHSIDAQGRLIHVSDVWLATLGYARDEVVGRSVTDFLTPESREYAIQTAIPEFFRVGRCAGIEYQLMCKDGNVIDVSLSSVVQRDAPGRHPVSLTVMEDVTERKRVQRELLAEHERLRVTLDSIGDGVIAVDANGRVDYLNPVAERLTGWTSAAARGVPSEVVLQIVDATSRRRVKSPAMRCLSGGAFTDAGDHAILLGRDCREYCIENSAAPIKSTSGETIGAVLVFRDVSEKIQLHREMTWRATHDRLTGLLNRDEFERHLQLALDGARVGKARYTLMYIDLDRFKLVNDAAGHAAGDRLLKHVVGIIKRFIRSDDTLARLGGDEFGLVVKDCGIEGAEGIAQRICDTLDSFRFHEGPQHFHVGASIGLVPVDERWPTAAHVLEAADSACYAAKAAGRNRVHAYLAADEVIESHREDMQWVRRLEQALDKGQFALHWQRINALGRDGGGVHGEVLLRMINDDGTLIPPARFLAPAERFQMASRIDRWVIRQVFEFLTIHRDRCAHLSTVAINLSGQSIGDRDFHRYVDDLMETMAIDAHKICFEITETAAIINLNDATSFFESMRARGVRFALDDFGSGVSSFGYLKALPVDYLKIGGQFINGLVDDPVNQEAVRCISAVARITGKKTVAECVETEAVEGLLRDMGIDYAQGFLRHRPAPIEEIFDAAIAP
ncbi:EAL domain-containing protein [Paraburkholderia sp. RL17-337-BIB-A]|uniref:EAL domain-containing protein n=1 Tax=Paraburkholderia sp. RL17-337-BIB-A TaxID=3031636 RepID=UPI0038BCFD2B